MSTTTKSRASRTRICSLPFAVLTLLTVAPFACGGISAESDGAQTDANASVAGALSAASATGEAGASARLAEAGAGGQAQGASTVARGGTGSTSVTAHGGSSATGPAPVTECGATRTDTSFPGFVICTGNGEWHRPEQVDCPFAGAAGASASSAQAAGGEGGATSIGCASDRDCPTNMLCFCGLPPFGGSCVPATCKTDADCGQGSWCELAQLSCRGNVDGLPLTRAEYGATAFACQSSADDCDSRADCPRYAGNSQHWLCAYDGQHRYCLDETAGCY